MAPKLSGAVAGDRPPWPRPHLAGFSLCRHLHVLKVPSSTALGDVSLADTRWERPPSLAETRSDTQVEAHRHAAWGAVLSGGRVADCPLGRALDKHQRCCSAESARVWQGLPVLNYLTS